jgi:hypothetical protein
VSRRLTPKARTQGPGPRRAAARGLALYGLDRLCSSRHNEYHAINLRRAAV